MAKKHLMIPPLSPQDILRFWSKVRIRQSEKCWPWMAGSLSNGYGWFALHGRPRQMRVAHRVAWVIAKGSLPTDICVCHHCDNRLCCNPSHLFLGTQADNIRDALEKGRLRQPGFCGEQNGNSRLTKEKVRKIRAEYAIGNISQRALATKNGVCQRTINMIIHNKTWVHIS